MSMSIKIRDFLFPYNPPAPPHPDKPPGCPAPESLISVHFGSVSVCFGSVWLRLALFRVCFGSVLRPFRGVGWGRGEGLGRGAFVREKNILGPAKTYILRGTPQTCAIKTRAVTDNQTIKKGLCKGNRGPVRGTDGPVRGTKGCNRNRAPFNCTKSFLIAPVPATVLIVGLRADL